MKVLIIEDDIEIQKLLSYFWSKEGFETHVADNGIDGLKILKNTQAELIILDIMLPIFDGKNFTKIVKELPEEYGNPIIVMLSAKTEIDDVLEGLELGADDYIKKPFDPREVILRGKKLIEKRSSDSNQEKTKKTKEIYTLKELTVDKTKRLVTLGNEEVELSNKEYNLLILFFNNPGIVLTRDKILDYVWGTDYFSGDRSVDVYVSKLREKLPLLSNYIKTVKGVGYKLEEKR